ncbi:hypothetical protein FVE85_1301 [Porphyridium purpureum]|uniref:Secretory immunoglobulin A-binding protein EsiB n=1 Tax=Porphyridium purpureum TaxID=35688 RepID=A0A5J4YJ84_PORPP|nr:hypothetical protein FVE85_1301 [Porphyridium purpureum]|eukprot:POR3686..scf251_18
MRVGVYYGTGKGGLKVDMYLAKEWFREAAAQGSEMAERYFHELENHAIDPENPNREAHTNILKLRRLLRKRERRSEG